MAQLAGCFRHALSGNGLADLCVNVRHEGPGWGAARRPPGQPPPASLCCSPSLRARHPRGPAGSDDDAQLISGTSARVRSIWPGPSGSRSPRPGTG